MNDVARLARNIIEGPDRLDEIAARILEYAARQAAYEAKRRARLEHLAGLGKEKGE